MSSNGNSTNVEIGYKTFFENLVHLAFVVIFNNQSDDHNTIDFGKMKIDVISKNFEFLLSKNDNKEFDKFIKFVLGKDIAQDYSKSLTACLTTNKLENFTSGNFIIDYPNHSLKSKSNVGILANYSSIRGVDNYHHVDIFSKVIYGENEKLLGFQAMFANADEKYRYFQQMNLSNIKSAIAAIMARNMSHNLGSHVFYYTRNQINGLSEDYNIIPEYRSDLKGLSWFLHYVQERQDFIATITGQDEYYMGPLNLKTDVLDEITPDAVDWRHSSTPLATNFILKYIVNSEGLCRGEKKGTEDDRSYLDDIEIIIVNGNNGCVFNSWDSSELAAKFYDLDLAVKGGQQSRHGFLIILENIIRNAAKHGYSKGNTEGLKINVRITENKRDGDYLIEIFDNCKNGKKAVPKIKEFIKNLKILGDNDSQSINRESKGLKEIIVCIAWLKSELLSDVFNYTSGIKAGILSIKNVDNNLCYSFTLPKFLPELAINESIIENLDNFKKHGQIHICNNKHILNKAVKHFPHASLKLNNGRYWESFAKYKANIAADELPLVIFERDGCLFKITNNFAFIPDMNNISEAAGNKRYIIFKNHLKKSTDSLKQYFEENCKTNTVESKINLNSPVFIDNLSGATYAFNLFQKAQSAENNDEIYFRIIESFYTRIIIVDERLCPIDNIESQLEKLILTQDQTFISSFVKKYFNNTHDMHIKNFEKIIFTNEQSEDKITPEMKLVELKKYWANKKFKKTDLENLDTDYNYTREFYLRQNVFLFNMNSNGDLIKPEGDANSDLAEIEPHFFSIHIGLLDKLNNQLITDQSTAGKLKFLKHKLNIPDNTYLAVHSGRGGLTEKQKRVTFIPFANLQWSLENCKFKLSELFYNQIYFPIN